jgi:hypothetical protein
VTVDPFSTSTTSRGPDVGAAAVVGGRLVAGRVVGGRLVVGAVVAGRVVAGAVVAGPVVAGPVVGGTVVAGAVGTPVVGTPGVTPGVPLMTPSPLSNPPPQELKATSSAMTAETAITP